MVKVDKKPKTLQVSSLFTNVKYEIPIYQRNYAWEEKQIEQLIEDIHSSKGTYFLGTLIVNQKEADVYEVIDGQQRLTTLYLLEKYLKIDILKGSLYFEAREKSNRTLSIIGTEEINDVLEELQSEELIRGYKIIEGYFLSEKIDPVSFREKLNHVQLIRIQVPKNIDLNHYFEIMNTRGEQLEFHEIVKAKLLSQLSTNEDKKAGSILWDACSNMDSYVQMNFDLNTRRNLFSDDWSGIHSEVYDFDKVRGIIGNGDHVTTGTKTLLEILTDKQPTNKGRGSHMEENERFESIISFPHFILQVNKAISKAEENESMLDDKNFLKSLELNWENEEKSKAFLYNLLKCRVLFDKYILKREFVGDYKETGKWSLQRLESYKDRGYLKPKYVGTFGGEDDTKNKQLRLLQSCLRITYTSPKTMHWISLVLTSLMNDENGNILEILEKYCNHKVRESKYENASGFHFERIVFTYLDYLIYRDGYSYEGKQIIFPLKDDWQFHFRNSIEHFYPQNPIDVDPSTRWNLEDLNGFGNLALITISGNSKFSNLPPNGKVTSYPNIIKQSLKLKIMREMMHINGGVWNQAISDTHKREMFCLLQGGGSNGLF
ncbi:DUF262 domain-containing HNH endonuclease family protein [Bacillus sp. 31A1R]|uniref:DUF262 domain-containing HNH endonuclease family protein n=1 Tax=Robertmurraya mangrovi TaxID=3098077 RepID=A0ABU5J1I5_9BACI|nr:DUF262 domain-containing HNH endonuclease family protein [Bacillus sp. 31A1R]MDZ5473283.1 DUF262 domain-containing HNH endonuclease family protein [Bacillus sp. 31A1R]